MPRGWDEKKVPGIPWYPSFRNHDGRYPDDGTIRLSAVYGHDSTKVRAVLRKYGLLFMAGFAQLIIIMLRALGVQQMGLPVGHWYDPGYESSQVKSSSGATRPRGDNLSEAACYRNWPRSSR